MTTEKKNKYRPSRVPVADVLAELGDPADWERDEAAYQESLRQRSEPELALAAKSPGSTKAPAKSK